MSPVKQDGSDELAPTQTDPAADRLRSIQPPPYPHPRSYTKCYCEENAYLLVEHLTHFAQRQALPVSGSVGRPHASRSIERVNGQDRDLDDTFRLVWDVRAIFISNAEKTIVLWQQCASKDPPETGSPVIWDYHVVVALTCTLVSRVDENVARRNTVGAAGESRRGSRSRTWIFDPDSRLSYTSAEPPKGTTDDAIPVPVPAQDYVEGTFAPHLVLAGRIPPHLRASARIVGAKDLLAYFASDRSHMMSSNFGDASCVAQGVWSSPPPPWPPITGHAARAAHIENNLMDRYVSMSPPSSPADAVYGQVVSDLELFSGDWMAPLKPGDTVPPSRTKAAPHHGDTLDGPTGANTVDTSAATGEGLGHAMRRTVSLPTEHDMAAALSAVEIEVAAIARSDASSSTSSSLGPLISPSSGGGEALSSTMASPCSSGSGPCGQRRGGRISSALFPAHLAKAAQSRASCLSHAAPRSPLRPGPDGFESGNSTVDSLRSLTRSGSLDEHALIRRSMQLEELLNEPESSAST